MDLYDALVSHLGDDSNPEPANVVDGLFAIARAIERNAQALERLGLNNATSDMGAVELLGYELKRIADRLEVSQSE